MRLGCFILANFSETLQVLAHSSSVVVSPLLLPFLVLKIFSSQVYPWKCQWTFGCLSNEALAYIFLGGQVLELISCLFVFFIFWPHVLILPPKRLSLFLTQFVEQSSVSSPPTHHILAAAPNTPLKTHLEGLPHALYCRSRDYFTGLYPASDFSSSWLSRPKLSLQHSHLLISITLHLLGFFLSFLPCLPFNVTFRALTGLFFLSHSASSMCPSTSISSTASFSSAQSSLLSSRQWVSLSLDILSWTSPSYFKFTMSKTKLLPSALPLLL